MDPRPVPPCLDDVRFAVVDIETTGLESTRHRILQVAVVTVDAAGNTLDEWSSYARPRFLPLRRLGPRKIHGITKAALRHAPSPAATLRELARRLDGAVLTAHNAEFDVGFLLHHSRRLGVAFPERPQVCTLTLSRSLDPQRSLSHRLFDVCERYGVPLDRPHDALADAHATAAVLPHLLREGGIHTWDQLAAVATPKAPKEHGERRRTGQSRR